MSNLTRREFLHLAAASGIGVTVLGAAVPVRAAHPPAAGMGVLIDIARCVGCRSCEAACKASHGFPAGESQELGPQAWTYVKTVPLVASHDHLNLGRDGAKTRTFKVQCMHCAEPACASACPVAALRKTPQGPVVYDVDRCIGCRYCMIACPFQVPRFEWRKAVPAIQKCTMCADRQAAGKMPACVEACPMQALEFGLRDRLLAEAARRIASDRQRYVPAIYGAEEAGGTSVLYVSDVPFQELGFPVITREPLATYTWRVLGKLPGVVIGLGATLTAVEAVVRRRMEMQGTEEGERR